MIVTKKFKGADGLDREWLFDWDNSLVSYRGYAKDFRDQFTIKINNLSAQELLIDVSKEEGLSLDNIK